MAGQLLNDTDRASRRSEGRELPEGPLRYFMPAAKERGDKKEAYCGRASGVIESKGAMQLLDRLGYGLLVLSDREDGIENSESSIRIPERGKGEDRSREELRVPQNLALGSVDGGASRAEVASTLGH